MGPTGADIMFLAILTLFIAVLFWVLSRESRIRNLKYAMVILGVAVLSPIYYAVIAPYYTVVPTGEYITYTVPSNVTTTINGTVTTISENVTVVTPKYAVNPAPWSYFLAVIVFSIIMVIIAMYYIFKWAMRYGRI